MLSPPLPVLQTAGLLRVLIQKLEEAVYEETANCDEALEEDLPFVTPEEEVKA